MANTSSDPATTDLLMKFVLGNDAVAAECQLSIDARDTLMQDFQAGKFFELEDFELGLSVREEDKGKGPFSQPAAGGTPAPLVKGAFAGFWKFSEDNFKEIYPVEFDTFSFTRLVDRASPIFLECCCNSKSFASATLIKRRSAGALGARAFLRMDFTDVLITGVAWGDGALAKEKTSFICRGAKVVYKRQKPDGTFAPSATAEWSEPRDG